MKKKVISLFLAVMLVTLAGCSGSDNNTEKTITGNEEIQNMEGADTTGTPLSGDVDIWAPYEETVTLRTV